LTKFNVGCEKLVDMLFSLLFSIFKWGSPVVFNKISLSGIKCWNYLVKHISQLTLLANCELCITI
jgi:hypothetical protein